MAEHYPTLPIKIDPSGLDLADWNSAAKIISAQGEGVIEAVCAGKSGVVYGGLITTTVVPLDIESSDKIQVAIGNSGQPIVVSDVAGYGIVSIMALKALAGGPGITPLTAGFESVKSDTAITFVQPANMLADDQLVVRIGIRGASTVTVTPPVGGDNVFVSVQQLVNDNGQLVLWEYRKKIGVPGNEPANYTFTLSTPSMIDLGYTVYRGVDTTTPVEKFDGAATVIGTNHSPPSVTTVSANTMIVVDALVNGATAIAPNAGYTERFDDNESPTLADFIVSAPFLCIIRGTQRFEVIYTNLEGQINKDVGDPFPIYIFANMTATSVEDHLPVFSYDSVDTETIGRVLLASVDGAGVITDLRRIIGGGGTTPLGTNLDDFVALVKAAVGASYFTGTPETPSLDARVDAIEANASLVASVVIAESGVVESLDMAEIGTLIGTGRLVHFDPNFVSDYPLLLLCIPGLYGDGTVLPNGASPDYFDQANSTVTSHPDLHYFD